MKGCAQHANGPFVICVKVVDSVADKKNNILIFWVY